MFLPPETFLCCTTTNSELSSSGTLRPVTVLGFSPRQFSAQHSLPPGSAVFGSAATRLATRFTLTRQEEMGDAGCWAPSGRGLAGLQPPCRRKNEGLPPPGPWVLRAPTQSLAEQSCWQCYWEHCQ